MISYKFEDPFRLAAEFEAIANNTLWKKGTVGDINSLINENLRLIMQQTENRETAPKLQKAMLALSDRISKEKICDTLQGHDLAFKIMAIARGLFNVTEKPDWESLPKEILENEIFSQIVLGSQSKDGLETVAQISKGWEQSAAQAKRELVNKGALSLREAYNCKTAKEAVQCIIDNKLLSANFQNFPDVTQEDLNKLIEKCPNLSYLFIDGMKILDESLTFMWCTHIKEDKFAETLTKLSNLTSLNFSECRWITGDKLANALTKLPNLTSLNLQACAMIRGDKLANALTKLPNLTSLNLGGCWRITGDKLAKALTKLPKLTSLNLGGCKQITEDKLAKALTKLPNLTSLDLGGCKQITEDKLAKALTKLPNLTSLDLGGCTQITGDKLAKALTKLPNLTSLDLGGCTQITGDKLAEALTKLPNLTSLDLGGCKQITEDKLSELRHNFPKIEIEG